MPIPALLAAAPGLIKAGASLFGSGKRKRAEQEAQARFDQQQAALENFQFENPYANQENVYEDATINQQATQVQQQTAAGNQANLADLAAQGLLDPSKVASAQLQSQQQIGADIARQEQGIQQRALGEQSRLNTAEAQGAANLQQQQFGQTQQQFNLAQQGLANAQSARQAATQDLVGGLAGAAGAFGASHFSDESVAARQANRAARAEDSPANRLKDLYSDSPSMKNGDEGPKKKKYSGDRFERKQLLKQLLEQGGHTFQDHGDGRYAIGGQSVTIDPVTGGFKGVGLAGKRAEEFFAKRAQHLYDKEYTKALKDAGLQAGFDERGGFEDDARSAMIESQIDQGTLNPYAFGEGSVTHSTALAEKALDTPIERNKDGKNKASKKKARPSSWESHFKRTKKLHDSLNEGKKKYETPAKRGPLYRMFKMKWKGMYK